MFNFRICLKNRFKLLSSSNLMLELGFYRWSTSNIRPIPSTSPWSLAYAAEKMLLRFAFWSILSLLSFLRLMFISSLNWVYIFSISCFFRGVKELWLSISDANEGLFEYVTFFKNSPTFPCINFYELTSKPPTIEVLSRKTLFPLNRTINPAFKAYYSPKDKSSRLFYLTFCWSFLLMIWACDKEPVWLLTRTAIFLVDLGIFLSIEST